MKSIQFSNTIAAVKKFDRAKFNWANTEFPMDPDIIGFLWTYVELAAKRVQEAFARENINGILIDADPEREEFRRFLGISFEVI